MGKKYKLKFNEKYHNIMNQQKSHRSPLKSDRIPSLLGLNNKRSGSTLKNQKYFSDRTPSQIKAEINNHIFC